MAQKKEQGTKKSKQSAAKSKKENSPKFSFRDLVSKVSEFWFGTVSRLRRFAWDVTGIILLSLASMSLLALFDLTSGVWLTPWALFLKRWFGWGSYLVLFGLGAAGLLLMRRGENAITGRHWSRVIAFEIAIFAAIAFFSVVGGVSMERAEVGLDGGLIGWGIARLLGFVFSPFPWIISEFFSALIFFFIMVIAALVGFNQYGKVAGMLGGMVVPSPAPAKNQVQPPPVREAFPPNQQVEEKKAGQKKVSIPPEYQKKFKVEEPPKDEVLDTLPRDDRLPPLDLLSGGMDIKPNEQHINQSAGLIEKTLAEFGIHAKVVGFKVGPTVTQFALQPGYIGKGGADGDEVRQKVRVSQISALQKDLALALSSERLRIQAPVPGRGYIGIEVPNKQSIMVRMRPILETENFYSLGSPLAVCLGRDVSGQPVVADLVKMPHLLIAGTTGSGKSVCIQSLAVSLIMNNTPEDLRLVMIDPKMVEMVRFNGLPHLYGKVETDLERISGVLRWVVVEMENRYKRLEEVRARDIDSYNRKVRRHKEYPTMPRIVVMIDELADLMMNAADTTETTIVRLAQMARAVGIHLVVATQRPSTNVVTGLIKANFPARLSFSVASGMDSRVILDTPGAETLLGRGDLLFIGPEGGAPVRAQGVMVSDKEIDNVINYWQQAWQKDEESREEEPAPWEEMLDRSSMFADKDDLIEKAIEVIRETRCGSASILQRRLRIGYPRAARLVDELEDMGILGPSRGGGRERDILINLDDDDEEEY